MATDIQKKILEIQVRHEDALKQIAAYRAEVEKAQEEQKKLKKDLKEGTISSVEYGKAMEASRIAVMQNNTAINVLTKQVINQQKQQEQNEGSLVQWRAELSNLTAEYDALSEAEREGARGAELKTHINEITANLKEAEQGTQRFFRNVGNYPTALATAATSTEGLVDALTKECKSAEEAEKANEILKEALSDIDPAAEGSADAIAALSKKIEDNSKVIEENEKKNADLVDTLGGVLGVNTKFGQSLQALSKSNSGAVLDGINVKAKALWSTVTGLIANPIVFTFLGITAVGSVVKWWYDYNKGLVEASRLTSQFTGMAGDEMKAFRNEVQAVADTFDADFQDVLATADALVAQFGISWEEALETVEKGFESGANANGDMLQQMQKMPRAMDEVGLSVQQMTALISQTTSGIWGTKGMEAIQQSGKLIREMSAATAASLDAIGISSKQVTADLAAGTKTTFDVMQEVAGKLKEMPEGAQAVGVVLKNVFGEQGVQAGKKQIENLANISTNLDECVAATGRVGEVQAEMVEAQTELNNAISALFDNTGGAFEEMTATAKLWVTQGLTAMVKGIVDVSNYLIDLYNESVVVRAGVALISSNFKVMWSVIKNVCGLIVDEVMSLGKIIKGCLTLNWDDVSAGWNQFRKATVKAVQSIAADAVETYKEGVDDIMTGKLKHIELKKAETTTATGESNTRALTATNSNLPTTINTSASTKKGNTTSSDHAKAEAELMRKAEDELLKITQQAAETQRKQLELGYERQIEDYQKKLTTDKTLTEKSREAINTIISSFEIQKQEALKKFDAEEIKRQVEHDARLMDLKLASVEEGSQAEHDLRIQAMADKEALDLAQAEAEYQNENEKQQVLRAIREKYAKERDNLNDEYVKITFEKQKTVLQSEIDLMQVTESERQNKIIENHRLSDEEYTQWRENGIAKMEEHQATILLKEEENAQAELDALLERGQLSTQTEEEFVNEQIAAREKLAGATANINAAILSNEQAKTQAMKGLTNSLTGLLDALGEKNKAFAMMSKIITLAQIAIDTGKALSSGIASASEVPFPGNIAAIATTVATVLANVTTAITTVKSAKFAEGGKVIGPGSGTSDSIPAVLSNGEFVMTAKATKIFEPILLAMNGIGSGVPIQAATSYESVSNNQMMSDSFERAAREIKPVVSVVEITEAQDRVAMIENLDNF